VKTITVGSDSGGNTQNSNGGMSTGSMMGGSNGQQGQSSTGNTDNTVITSKSEFKFWDKLSAEIDTILSRDGDIRRIESKSIVNRTAGIITITGTKNQIERISDYLDKVTDRIHKQVILETQLFELTYANTQSTGVDWSKLEFQISGDLGKTWGGLAVPNQYSYKLSMDGVLNFLNKYGKVHTLSTPKILTLNNQPAVINVGKQINYRYQSGSLSTVTTGQATSNVYIMSSVFIGLTLNIIPEITDDGYVILRINPVVSAIDDDSESADVVDEQGVRIMPPDIKIKQLSSIVKAHDGNRVIIGGLVSESTKNRDTDVTLFGDIPIFGKLFKSTNEAKYRSELIVVITPRIIKHNKFPSIDRVEKLLNGEIDE
jgi:general secretion pathway protein D